MIGVGVDIRYMFLFETDSKYRLPEGDRNIKINNLNSSLPQLSTIQEDWQELIFMVLREAETHLKDLALQKPSPQVSAFFKLT